MSNKLTLTIITLAILVGLVISGCQSKPSQSLKEGLKLYQKGKFKQAAAKLERATKDNPKSFKAHFILGKTYESQGKLDKALAEYQKASKIAPKNVEARYSLSIIYRSKSQYKQAIAELEKAVKANQSFTGAWLMLADSYLQNKQYDKAITTSQYILKAQFAEVDLTAVHLQMAKAYKGKGDIEKAKKELKETLKKDPENKEAQKLLKVLDKQ